MKVFSYILSSILIMGIIVYIAVVGVQSMKSTTVSTDLDVKKLKSSDLLEYVQTQDKVEDENDEDEKVEEDTTDEDETEEASSNEKEEAKEEDVVEEVSAPMPDPQPVSDVLETQVGSLSGYGPDCRGCTGFLSSGRDVRNGNIYYQDSTYGQVRILAGDKSYSYGTIVRVKSSRLGTFLAIVLDRGGSVGFGKSHLFDLLYSSSAEALANEVSYNTTFEILRYGY
jgi:hypothetical protein